MFVVEVLVILFAASIIVYVNQLVRYRALKPIKGPPLLPIVGNLFEFKRKPEELYHDISRLTKKYGNLFQLWLGPTSQYIVVMDPDIVQKILSSSKHINKQHLYDYLLKWLGYGLLTNNGEKWRKRRKFLTPAFHFTILEKSVENFSNASDTLIKKLAQHVNGDVFDIYPYITLCGLDIICETAMGIKVNAQTHADSEYVCAVRNVCNIASIRVFSILEQFNFYFNNFSTVGQIYHKSVQILHETSRRVIREKRMLLAETSSNEEFDDSVEHKKKPMAFLDALLKCTIDGVPLTDTDIREEVDTFMFEGHDTVSSGIAFTLYLLANHPQIQENLFEEIRTILGNDQTHVPTIAHLNSMKYLEAVIKESLRLYPPAPIIGRQLAEDLQSGDVTLPKDSLVIILIHWLHRQSKLFPQPHIFRPERFLNRNGENNHFCFVPFSAGPRNCIGQKFAMYEMKLIISKILRNFELLPAGSKYDLKLIVSAICKSVNGIPIRLKERKYMEDK